jgi:hypothetical protein
MRILTVLFLCLAVTGAAPAAEGLRLVVQPQQVELRGSLDRCQVLATLEQDGPRDRTATALWSSADPKIVTIEAGLLTPRGNGTTVITAAVGSSRAAVAVTVGGMDAPPVVSFRRDVLAALSVSGCNQGACHGAEGGKGGLRLSLRGCDPAADFLTITRGNQGRRIDTQQPAASLLVTKGLSKVAASGCKGFVAGTLPVEVLLAWIAQGAPDDAKVAPLHHLEVAPSERKLIAPDKEQQLATRAVFNDGHQRDVTGLTVYTSSDAEVAVIDATGRVRFQKPGEVAILCRYLEKLHTVRLAYHEPKPGFAWEAAPEVNFIDKHVFAKLRKLELLPAELCSDAIFLRRVCLDLCALQPPPEMMRAFIEDPDPRKREKLVEQLLERGDHADFWALKWLDALRSSRGTLQVEGANVYRVWWRAHVRDNTPFDAVVRELLTAQGNGHTVGAANYFRGGRTPAELAEITSQLFLGTRIGCARCHNHPHENWTQDDFAGLAAFFARVKVVPDPAVMKKPRPEIVTLTASGEMLHPRTGKVVPPRFPGGLVPEIAPDVDRREVFAKWLTTKENRFFARAIVNRTWAHLFGRGIVEPLDDMRASNPPANEELLDALADDFARHNFDMKHLLRTILASRTYQLSSLPHPLSKDDQRYFSRNYPRMMTPEQLIDAVSAITEVPEKYPDLPAGTRAIQVPDPWAANPFLQLFGRPAREPVCESPNREMNLATALHVMNSDNLQKKLQDPRNRIGRLIEKKASDREITEELFLATLCRLPKPNELDQVAAHVAKMGMSRRQALEDILWALLNTKEFMYRH